MNKHIDDTGLNDYAEGLASEDLVRHVDQHLAVCEECSGRLQALTQLLSELAELPDAATPARDLWSDVRAEIDAGSGQEAVDPPKDEVGLHGSTVRRISFSIPQLLAASVVWTLLSGGVVWMALDSRVDQVRVAVTDDTRLERAPGGAASLAGRFLPVTAAATTEYEQAIASLESILEQGRDQLNPQTIETIEASLAAIDRAIEEARVALADDPNSRALNRLLIKHQQSKLRVLRQASSAVQI